jgi:hypothetical protein
VCRTSSFLNAAAGPLEVVRRGIEHSDKRVRRKAIPPVLQLAQDGHITIQYAAGIIAARLEDVDFGVQRAAIVALGKLGEHAAPHIATLVAVIHDEDLDWRSRVIGMRTLVLLAKVAPAVADYIAEVDHWKGDDFYRATAEEVLRAFERAGLLQRSDVDIYGRLESADRDVLRLWMHGVWTVSDRDFEGCRALQELWGINGSGTEWEGITFGDAHDAVTVGRVVSICLRGKLVDFDSRRVPAQLGELDALTTLWLDGNYLIEIPATLGRLSSLTSLRLDDNMLTELPVELGDLSSLSELSLNCNQLESLPPELGALNSLTELQVDDNCLTEVPVELAMLSSLKKLCLQGNGLTKLPPDFGRLLSLTSLYLMDNKLTHVPVELGQLVALEVLHLGSNNLTHVPVELGGLRSLKELQLNVNELTSVPAELGEISSLEILWLTDNSITSLPSEFARFRERGGNLILDRDVKIKYRGARRTGGAGATSFTVGGMESGQE